MKIWVDADACPKAIKEILFRAAERMQLQTTFVSNKRLWIPESDFVGALRVPGGFDVADERIVALVTTDDIVVTDDIPFAANAIEKGAYVLSFRGHFYTEENIRERLSVRNFMADLREAGVETGGPSSFRARDTQAFANQLDRFLAKMKIYPKAQ